MQLKHFRLYCHPVVSVRVSSAENILSADTNFIPMTEHAVQNGITRQNLPIDRTTEDHEARREICTKLKAGLADQHTYQYISDLLIFIWATDPFAQRIFDLIERCASVNSSGVIKTNSDLDYLKIAQLDYDVAVIRGRLACTSKSSNERSKIMSISDIILLFALKRAGLH